MTDKPFFQSKHYTKEAAPNPSREVRETLWATGGEDVPKRVRIDAPISSRGCIRELAGILRRAGDTLAALDTEMKSLTEEQFIRMVRGELVAVQSRLKDLHKRDVSVLREKMNQPVDQTGSLRVVKY